MMLQATEKTTTEIEWIPLPEALQTLRQDGVEIHDSTMRRWAATYPGFAKKVGGRWRINTLMLEDIVSGQEPLRKKQEDDRAA